MASVRSVREYSKFSNSVALRYRHKSDSQGADGQQAKTFAEFFAGIGLMRMGLESQGWTIKFANDIDVEKHSMYQAHFKDPEPHFVIGDIHKLPASCVPNVTLATASFPCNDLSLAGSRNGLRGQQSSAFWGFVRVIDDMAPRRPPLLLIENVPGFLTSHGGEDFANAMLSLNSLGYSVDPFMIDASRFVPQSRLRLFVVAKLREICVREEVLELVANELDGLRPPPLISFVKSHPDICWSIRRLPNLPTSKLRLSDILDDLPNNAEEWWSPERAEYLLNQMSDRHRRVAEEMIARDSVSFGTVFRRVRNSKSMAELRVDGTAGCLRTPRGGSGRQILFKAGIGRYQVRLLTPRECSRLMGADDYVLSGPQNRAFFGFGDAVCVPVVEWIAKNALNPLVECNQLPIDNNLVGGA